MTDVLIENAMMLNVSDNKIEAIETIKEILKSEKSFIDNHTARIESADKWNFVILKTGDICPISKTSLYTSLNPLFIGHDHKVHLSMCSVAGVVIRNNYSDYNHQHIQCETVVFHREEANKIILSVIQLSGNDFVEIYNIDKDTRDFTQRHSNIYYADDNQAVSL